MKKTGARFVFAVYVLVLGSCASPQEISRDRLNHPAADLSAGLTAGPSFPLSSMGSIRKKASQSGCSVCAH